MIENLMSDEELGKLLGYSRKTLETWRSRRIGPPWIKTGRRIFYDKRKVDLWLEAQACDPATMKASA
jgi:hypothetical protein